MVLRFLGESVTDSNGLAVLPDGYTGTGAGEVDIIAKTTIDESTVVSQPYTVMDCIYLDIATSQDNKNTYWYHGNCTISDPSTDGTTVTESGNGASYLISNVADTDDWTNRRFLDVDFCVEFDCDNVANTQAIFYCTGVGPKILNLTDGHYKFLVTSTGITVSINGGTPTVLTDDSISGQLSMGFVDTAVSSLSELVFKNFVVYPI